MSSRILVVDDNPLNRLLLRDLLELDEHEVHEADSVQAGLERLEEGPFDLVLLDIQLGSGRGQEVLRGLRRSSAHAATTVWAVTAHALRGDEAKYLAEGFDGYVSKPFDTVALRERIREHLDAGGGE